VQPERLPIAAHEPHPLVSRDAAQRRRRATEKPQPGVGRQVPGSVVVDHAVAEECVHVLACDIQVGHSRPAGRHHVEGVVLVGLQPDGGGLHAQRHVLAHQHHLAEACPLALGGQVEGAGQDAAVVGIGTEPRGEHLRVSVVELDVQGSACGADRHRRVQAAVFDAQLVEHAQRRAGEPPQFRVVPLALEFGDHHERQDDLVLVEPGQ
jgi:hypothetical protein